jgi:hypothetical protein
MGNKRQIKKNRQALNLQSMINASGNNKQDINASIDFLRDIDIEAVGMMENGLFPKPSKFNIKAYDGGLLRVAGWWLPIVIDLEGITSEQEIPILDSHQKSLDNVYGQTDMVEISATEINESGQLYSNIEKEVAKIVAKAKDGHKWKASVGASPLRVEEIMEDTEVTVNGQTFQGPIFVARESVLKETSIVVIGAANDTDVNIAAKNLTNKEANMDPKDNKAVATKAGEQIDASVPGENQKPEIEATDNKPVAPVSTTAPIEASDADKAVAKVRDASAGEVKRIVAINALEAPNDEIKAEALEKGWSPVEAELAFLRAKRPEAPSVITGDSQKSNIKAIEAKAMLACGMHEDVLAKSYDDQTMDIALTGRRSSSIKALIQACMSADGKACPELNASEEDWVLAGFSTQSLAGVLSNLANKFLKIPFESNDDFNAVLRVCKEHSLKDLKLNSMYRMLTDNKLPEVPGGGPVELDTLTDSTSTLQAKTHGKRIGLTRAMMINDDLNAFAMIPQKLGFDAHDEFTDQFVTLIETTADSSFFSTANGNRDTSGAAIDVAGYTLMQTKFAALTDDNDKRIGVRPVAVIVPSALDPAAKIMWQSTNLFAPKLKTASAAGQVTGDGNPFQNNYEVIQIAKLTDATDWYGLANPARVSAFNVGFLNGQRSPFVDVATAGADSEMLGKFFRIIWDFGFALGDTQGAVKMTDS